MRATERFTMRITPELREALERAAAAEGRSVSNYIIRALEVALTASGKAAAPAPATKRKAATR